jgi:hypothetical protein
MASSMPPPSLASRKRAPSSLRPTRPFLTEDTKKCDTHLSGVT